jgi:hypothetical protein
MISKLLFVLLSYSILAWCIYIYLKQEEYKNANAFIIGVVTVICILETIKLIVCFIRL